MSIGSAIFQGIVQGLTEFLPISSSGHLSLVQYFTGQAGEESSYFTILLHLGTLLAVCIAFRRTIGGLIVECFGAIRDFFRGRLTFRDAPAKRRMLYLLVVSLLPLGLTVLLKDWFSALSSDNSILAEGLCFLLTSFLLFIADRCVKGRKNAASMKYGDAVAIGVAQAIAPLPGLSRSGSTIAVGLMVGLDRKYAVAFSFIMGIPAVLGANILEFRDAMETGLKISWPVMLTGMAVALVFGLIAIKMVNWLVTSDKFKYFTWYTMILGILTVGIALLDKATGQAVQHWVMGLLT